uniref:non-specific serine/threonine protein kinase n=1 Tax=Oryza glumipatula TaxID=40148 RepID=A0A0E0AZG6_9ORYZ
MLAIASDGNMVLSDGATGHALWSTNVTAGVNSSASGGGGGAMAVLANSSNLVLRLPDGTALWKTFEHPGNTFLPGMKIGVIYRTRDGVRLVSWKGATDPSPGKFSFGGDLDQLLQVVIWKGSRVSWRINPWEGYMVDSNYQKGGKSVWGGEDELVGIGKDELAGGQTHGGGGARWCGEDELAGVGEDELASSLMSSGSSPTTLLRRSVRRRHRRSPPTSSLRRLAVRPFSTLPSTRHRSLSLPSSSPAFLAANTAPSSPLSFLLSTSAAGHDLSRVWGFN